MAFLWLHCLFASIYFIIAHVSHRWEGGGDRGVHIEVIIAGSGFKVIISLILRTSESKLAIILSERGQKDTEINSQTTLSGVRTGDGVGLQREKL